jgi:hypothetical protein
MKYTFHFYLQMLMICRPELQVQLQKSCQTCFVTSGKKFIIGSIFVVLHLEVTLNCNCDISDRILCVWLHTCVFGFCLPCINKCLYSVKVVKLLLKHPVFQSLDECHAGVYK